MFHSEAAERSGLPRDAKGIAFKEERAGVKETVLPKSGSGRGTRVGPKTDSAGGLLGLSIKENFPLRPP